MKGHCTLKTDTDTSASNLSTYKNPFNLCRVESRKAYLLMWRVYASRARLSCVSSERITAVCDHCNYKVQGSLHTIYHHLEVARIFQTKTDTVWLMDVCVRRVGVNRIPAKVLHYLKLFKCWVFYLTASLWFYMCSDHLYSHKAVSDVMGCGKMNSSKS